MKNPLGTILGNPFKESFRKSPGKFLRKSLLAPSKMSLRESVRKSLRKSRRQFLRESLRECLRESPLGTLFGNFV